VDHSIHPTAAGGIREHLSQNVTCV